ncbi:MAG: twin-arginine translocase subunit TatC, partial [Caldilineae bacterium]
VTQIVFWIGVAFETPLVIAFLARIGLVSGPRLLSLWRQAIVIISVVAAMITPTVDPVNMSIVMLPLIVLYFMGVGLAYLLYRPRAPRDVDELWKLDDDDDE